MLLPSHTDEFFYQVTSEIKAETKEVQPYIHGVLTQYVQHQKGFPNDSVTLLFIQAQDDMSFHRFQSLGDWIFFLSSIFPTAAQKHQTVYSMVGKTCYSRCHNLLNKKWMVFEELADNFNYFALQVSEQIQKASRSL